MKRIDKILSVFMILTIIGALLLPGVMCADIDDFTITVSESQNTALQSIDTAFGGFTAGSSNEIDNSFNLTNSGNIACNVGAQFTTFNGTVYGFDASTGYIAGTNFYMKNTNGATPAWVALTATAVDADMGATQNIATDNVADNWAVRLIVPSGQSAGDYIGTIQLTFSNE